jgi:ATP-dependent helicase Lhr and Lhr-like helicase
VEAFERLSPSLQFQIANTLAWPGLRPVQELSTHAILDGNNCVVLAPTAGGKTEAAFFPTLSQMDASDWRPVSVLYLSPIRALLNNQEQRLSRYAEMLGRRAFKWHGDTTQSQRKRFINDPADILLTTPESLEAMLMSARVPAGALFGGLQSVIIDEVHAFANDDRGAHLSAVLERLMRFCGRDLQRIGLSATVGNPEEILGWLCGNSERPRVVVRPPIPPSNPELRLDFVQSLENAAHVLTRLYRGEKRLVFADSRRDVEQVGNYLVDHGIQAFVAHGSLAAAQRRDAEEAFERGNNCVIVATSALELGIDVGDLDRVIQIDSPPSVASFLQRMGRTGRRGGTRANCLFLATKEERLLQAAALLKLRAQGYVEPVRPRYRAAHILAHQILALAVQLGGVPSSDWWAWVSGASAFRELEASQRTALIEHMLAERILVDHDGKYWLGEAGEKRYGRMNFSELYAVFSVPRVIRVLHHQSEIGSIGAEFLEALDAGKQTTPAFMLGARAWAVQYVDWEKGSCAVVPAPVGKAPRWQGSPQFLHYDLCQAMRALLVSDAVEPEWTDRARLAMTTLRAEHAFLADSPSPITRDGQELKWWTFAGGRANNLLAKLVEEALGGECSVRNSSITVKGAAAQSEAGLRAFIRQLEAEQRPSREDARRHAQSAARSRVSKFEPCLPEALLCDLLAEMVVDTEGARRAAAIATTPSADDRRHDT